MKWLFLPLLRCTDFQGRSTRAEFLGFLILLGVASLCAAFLDHGLDVSQVLGALFAVLTLPGLAVAIRRLHDSNLPGWALLVLLIPFIGQFLFLAALLRGGTRGSNDYGPDPLGSTEDGIV
ncbi:MAG: DUF805 domain-containing protein [Fibrobacteria bacterium]|nr:DUF805 domain-containing protein [Fibrobacteria bacterium]